MGSREGSSKVILLITDGKSTKSFKTIPAALRARNKGIVIFAIGVGNDVNVQELEDVANKPVCTHVIQMKEYSDLNALVDEIQQVSCIAPTVLKRGKYIYHCTQGDDYQVTSIGTSTMITIDATDGMVNIYGSLSNPNPSEAGHDFYSNAIPGTTSVILINNNHKPVYFNISSNVKPFSCVGNYTVNIGNIGRVKPNAMVTCVDVNAARTCSVVEVYAHLYTLISPPYSYANPCIKGLAGFRPHPFDSTMFLFCNGNQNIFQFACPLHHIYDVASKDCIVGEPSSPSTTAKATTPSTKATTPSTKPTTPTTATTSTKVTVSTSVPISTRIPTSTEEQSTSTRTPTSTTIRSTSQTTSTEATTTSSTKASTSTSTSTTMSSTSARTTTETVQPSTRLPTTVKLVTTRSPSTSTILASRTTAAPLKSSTDSVFRPNYGPDGPCSDVYVKQNGGSLLFPYAKDKTKFIECTNFPNFGYVKACPDGRIWDQPALTCVFESVVINPSENKFDKLPNPCTNFFSPENVFFPHPTDIHMYIHCDQYGNAFEKTCPAHKVWHQDVLQCIPQGLFLG